MRLLFVVYVNTEIGTEPLAPLVHIVVLPFQFGENFNRRDNVPSQYGLLKPAPKGGKVLWPVRPVPRVNKRAGVKTEE